MLRLFLRQFTSGSRMSILAPLMHVAAGRSEPAGSGVAPLWAFLPGTDPAGKKSGQVFWRSCRFLATF
jgi:hypothetical protein